MLAGIASGLCFAELISTVQLWARGGARATPVRLRFRRAVRARRLAAPDRTGGDRFGPGRGARDLRGRRLSQWAKHGALDWIFDTAIAVVALFGVGVAIAVLVTRSTRSRAAVTAATSAARGEPFTRPS